MKRVFLALLVVAGLAQGVQAGHDDDDDARVEYVAKDPSASAAFDTRAKSDTGRALRQAALERRGAYETALAGFRDISELDVRIAAAKAEHMRLNAEREAVALDRSAQHALLRDAWADARDVLLAMQQTPEASPAELEAAQARADGAQHAFSQALAALPEVQELDLKIAAAQTELRRRYIERREIEVAHADDLAVERQAMDDDEKAYLEYVYGP